jgi:hypothetical protein
LLACWRALAIGCGGDPKPLREAAGLIRQLEVEMDRRPAVMAPGSMVVDDLTEEQLLALGYIE